MVEEEAPQDDESGIRLKCEATRSRETRAKDSAHAQALAMAEMDLLGSEDGDPFYRS